MILNHTEKEFMSAITTYEGKAKSLAKSKFFYTGALKLETYWRKT